MRLFRIMFICLMIMVFAAPVFAQYDLYGSPDPLRMPTAQPTYTSPVSAPVNGSPPGYVSQPAYVPPVLASRPTPTYVTPNPAYGLGYGSQYQTSGTAVPGPSRPMVAPAASSTSAASGAAVNSGLTGTVPGVASTSPVSRATAVTPSDPAAPEGPTVMSQMLEERGQVGRPSVMAGSGGYLASGDPASACTPTCSASGSGGLAMESGCCPWYGSISALTLTRTDPNKLWVSADSVDETIQYMNSQECRSAWKWGGEIRLGRRFTCCNPCESGFDPSGYSALEATYWTLDRFHGYREVWGDPNPLNTPLRVSDVHFIDLATPATVWFNGAGQQWLERFNEIHNVELSFIHGRWANADGSPWDFAGLVGFRYFRFDESLTFGTVQAGFAKAPDQNNAYIRDRILNNLWGGQIGGEVGYNLTANLRFFAIPKVGIYGNSMTNRYRIALGDGTPPVDFPAEINSSKSCVSFLMQVDLGGEYFFARNWSLRAGYRVLAVSGIGLADNQIPWAVLQALDQDISSNADLVLHGGYLSLTYNF
jgi:hypothetical protein